MKQKSIRVRRDLPTPKSFWSYQASTETPTLAEAKAMGAIAQHTTESEWNKLTPGMKREIVRSVAKRNPRKRDFRGRFKKKRYASPAEARAIFDRMYARGEAEREAHLRTPAGEAERQAFNRRTLERLRMRKNPRNDTAVELALFIENDGQIYRSQTLPIIKNLQRKIAKGTYNPTLALKLWRHLADRGAHDYFKQHGEPHTTTWFKMFSTADRNDAAKLLAEKYEEHVREAQPTRVIRRRRNPVVGKFYVQGLARGRAWYYRHSTQSFTDSREKATAYRSRAHAESIAKSLVRRLPQSIESITVKP